VTTAGVQLAESENQIASQAEDDCGICVLNAAVGDLQVRREFEPAGDGHVVEYLHTRYFIGTLLGGKLSQVLNLPEPFVPRFGGHSRPSICSIVGGALFVAAFPLIGG